MEAPVAVSVQYVECVHDLTDIGGHFHFVRSVVCKDRLPRIKELGEAENTVAVRVSRCVQRRNALGGWVLSDAAEEEGEVASAKDGAIAAVLVVVRGEGEEEAGCHSSSTAAGGKRPTDASCEGGDHERCASASRSEPGTGQAEVVAGGLKKVR